VSGTGPSRRAAEQAAAALACARVAADATDVIGADGG